jgi:hypothetical protein
MIPTDMFMWEWQNCFQKIISILVKDVFEMIGFKAVANIFFIGIPANNEDAKNQKC